MAVEQLTYIQIAERLGINAEAARGLVRRHRLPRSTANDGKTLIAIDFSEVQHRKASRNAALSARAPGDHGNHLRKQLSEPSGFDIVHSKITASVFVGWVMKSLTTPLLRSMRATLKPSNPLAPVPVGCRMIAA